MKALKSTILVLLLSSLSCTLSAQLEIEKETKKYAYSNDEMSVQKAGSGDLINRLYYWGVAEFEPYEVVVERDDTTFKSVIFKVTQPLVPHRFGTKHLHKDRVLRYTLEFNAEKKEYKYRIDDFHYKCLEILQDGEEVKVDGPLEGYKGASKRSLLDEVEMMCEAMVDAFSAAAEEEISDAAEEEAERWKEAQEEANEAAEEAAEEARKKAEAEAKQKAKEEAAAARAAEKAAKEKERAAPESNEEDDEGDQ